MISFCDIPLSLAKNQIERYGSYAMGMTKEWGIHNNLNPVVYLEKNSLLSKDIQATIDNMLKSINTISTQVTKVATPTSKMLKKSLNKVIIYYENITPEKKTLSMEELQISREHLQNSIDSLSDFKELSNRVEETVNNIGNLFRYIKNYEGTLTRNDKTISNYRFYDEREWRYVPALNDNRVKKSLNASQYKEYRGISKSKPFIENINLPFNSNDIKYLIVKSNNDIGKLIRAIKSIDNLTKNSNDTDILTTRILTVQQLNNDF
jgi:hypothetical protein